MQAWIEIQCERQNRINPSAQRDIPHQLCQQKMRSDLRRRNEKTNTDSNDGTQQQGSEITRTDTFKGNETQTSIPTKPKDRREWIQIGLS